MTDPAPATTAAQAGALAPSLFLSPHFDDVVLSCGGTVARLTAGGIHPTVLTVFAGEMVDDFVNDFARWKHSRWGIDRVEDVLDQRQSEEAAAAAILAYEPQLLGIPDAIYRGDRYSADQQLYSRPNRSDGGLVGLITQEVRALPVFSAETIIYVPLAAGEHVDHQIVHEVGQELARAGNIVFAYEDTPYGIHTPSGVERRLAALGGRLGAPQFVSIAETIEARIAAIAAYSTQVPVLFRFTDDFAAAIRAHAAGVGGTHGLCERYWPVMGWA